MSRPVQETGVSWTITREGWLCRRKGLDRLWALRAVMCRPGLLLRRTGESIPMDGISLTRIARAAMLPVVIGISAVPLARGDDPVTYDSAPTASGRRDASNPASASFGGIRSPRNSSASPSPVGPSSSPPSTTGVSPTRRQIAGSVPVLPSSWWPKPEPPKPARRGRRRRIGAGSHPRRAGRRGARRRRARTPGLGRPRPVRSRVGRPATPRCAGRRPASRT